MLTAPLPVAAVLCLAAAALKPAPEQIAALIRNLAIRKLALHLLVQLRFILPLLLQGIQPVETSPGEALAIIRIIHVAEA